MDVTLEAWEVRSSGESALQLNPLQIINRMAKCDPTVDPNIIDKKSSSIFILCSIYLNVVFALSTEMCKDVFLLGSIMVLVFTTRMWSVPEVNTKNRDLTRYFLLRLIKATDCNNVPWCFNLTRLLIWCSVVGGFRQGGDGAADAAGPSERAGAARSPTTAAVDAASSAVLYSLLQSLKHYCYCFLLF